MVDGETETDRWFIFNGLLNIDIGVILAIIFVGINVVVRMNFFFIIGINQFFQNYFKDYYHHVVLLTSIYSI